MRPNIPKPLRHALDLALLLKACGVETPHGITGGYFECPLCHGTEVSSVDLSLPSRTPRKDTLQVIPTLGNDYAMRCHHCGFAGNGIVLHWMTRRGHSTWEQEIQRLIDFGVFGDQEPDPAWLERAKAWLDFEPLLRMAMTRRHQDELHQCQSDYGEIGVIPTDDFRKNFPWAAGLGSYNKKMVYLRLVRTIHGLPAYVAIDQITPGVEITRYYFNDPGAVELMTPQWALYRDWSTELIAMTDLNTAIAHRRTLNDPTSIGANYAPVWIVNCTGPIHEEIPTRRIHYFAGANESGEFALAFCGGSPEVKVWKVNDGERVLSLPDLKEIQEDELDAVDFLADMILERTQSGSHAIAYLDSLLKKPWVRPAATAALTEAVAQRLDSSFDHLVREAGTIQAVLPFVGDTATYLCRNSLYLKTIDKKRSRFQPCSNFSLQIEESSVADGGVLGHSLQLRMRNRKTSFRINEPDFQDGAKLMGKVTAAALAAQWPFLPNLTSRADLVLLPSIVRGTQSAPRLNPLVTSTWGFSPGRFHVPDYSVTRLGLTCHRSSMNPPGGLSLLDREMAGVAPGEELEFIRFRANEFSSWCSGLDGNNYDLVEVILNAALYWLFVGSKGSESYLALPTLEHHALFASLVGIRPIEVGRARQEHPGVPRLMASTYSSWEQFHRQGRIVAALEATDRRLDNRVTSLLHRYQNIPGPATVAPFSLFPLLVYALVGQRSFEDAKTKLLQLIENRFMRNTLHHGMARGMHQLAQPGEYLDLFLKCAAELYCCTSYVVDRDEKRGTVLFKTESIKHLEPPGYHFDERRIADELRRNCGVTTPIRRYGRSRIRVFQIPAGKFEIFDAAVREKRRI